MTRDEALEKVRKLLAMSSDARGNVNEAANAARMASALMSKFQIDSAETVLASLSDDEEFGQEWVRAAGHAGADEHEYKKVPTWCGVVAVGVARLWDCKVDCCWKPGAGGGVRFSGYKTDTVVASWMFVYLVESVNRASDEVTGRAAVSAFKTGAGGELQRRLYALRAEKLAEFKASAGAGSTSTALVVVDRKASRVAEMFGEQKSRNVSTKVRDGAAYAAGRAAGARINLNTNRPLQGGQNQGRLQ